MNNETKLNKSELLKTPLTLNISRNETIEKVKSNEYSLNSNQQTNNIRLIEVNYLLKEGEYRADGIKVIKYLFQSQNSKYYLANIEEINENVLIKAFPYDLDEPKDEELINTLYQDIDKVCQFYNDNILSYYELIMLENEKKALIIMENIPEAQTLSVYLHTFNKYNMKPKGLKPSQIKTIIQGILKGLSFLHDNNIIHMQLNPKNILVDKDLKIVKVTDYLMRTNEFDVTNYPYYSSPELCFNKAISPKTDIWSVGCILFEIFTGYQPYGVMKSIDPLFTISQCISPIEAADDDIKDYIYNRKNRIVLDFLNKCFRPNESTRPSVDDLLIHKMLE